MMFGSAGEPPAIVTLVLRVWRAGPPHGTAEEIRYEATHVQTGDVAYFRSLESAAQHIRCLVDQVKASSPGRAPIRFPQRPGIDSLAIE